MQCNTDAVIGYWADTSELEKNSPMPGQLVSSCCHFGQADCGLNPDPDAVLYEPGPIVSKLLKYFKFWQVASLLTGAADWFSGSGNPLTNCMQVPTSPKPSHIKSVHSMLCTLRLWIQTDERGEKRYRKSRQKDEWDRNREHNYT